MPSLFSAEASRVLDSLPSMQPLHCFFVAPFYYDVFAVLGECFRCARTKCCLDIVISILLVASKQLFSLNKFVSDPHLGNGSSLTFHGLMLGICLDSVSNLRSLAVSNFENRPGKPVSKLY